MTQYDDDEAFENGVLRDRECTLEIRFRFRRNRLRQLKRDFPGNAIDLGLAPPFLGCLYRRHRFTNAARSIIELAEFRVGSRQIR
jgi:hypothetical protein